jgi:pyruvate/2-oxoglutarate dehydrogenase complex dihydrolipoamide dehydrogenase (E3) component
MKMSLLLVLLLTPTLCHPYLLPLPPPHPSRIPAARLPVPDLSVAPFPPAPYDLPHAKGCQYDLVVLGAGPAGETAAVRASKFGARVALVEVRAAFGGPAGLTSKAVREATKRIVGAVGQIGGDSRRQVKRLWRNNYRKLRTESESLQAAETRARLQKARVDLYVGKAEFLPSPTAPPSAAAVPPPRSRLRRLFSSSAPSPPPPPTTPVSLQICRDQTTRVVTSRKVIIATGSRPNLPARYVPPSRTPAPVPPPFAIPWKPKVVMDATGFASVSELPSSVAVVGGGVIAVEYATVLARLRVGVTLLTPKSGFLPFLSKELRRSMRKSLKENNILVVESPLTNITLNATSPLPVTVSVADGRRLRVETCL